MVNNLRKLQTYFAGLQDFASSNPLLIIIIIILTELVKRKSSHLPKFNSFRKKSCIHKLQLLIVSRHGGKKIKHQQKIILNFV